MAEIRTRPEYFLVNGDVHGTKKGINIYAYT